GGLYPSNPNDPNTYGVTATFVTSADVPDEPVYTVVKAVFDNLDDLKKLHPAFAHLTAEDMVKNGLSAPLHAGAAKYFKQKGLLYCCAGRPRAHRGGVAGAAFHHSAPARTVHQRGARLRATRPFWGN